MSRRLPVRRTDPWTSWVAAFDTFATAPRLKVVVLSALDRFGPLTHDQLIEAVNRVRPASPSGVRTRCHELVEDGVVEQVPNMVSKSRFGRASLLWRIVP